MRSLVASTGAARFDSDDAGRQADAARALDTTRPDRVSVSSVMKCQRERQRAPRASTPRLLDPRLHFDLSYSYLVDKYTGRQFEGDSQAESASPLICNTAQYRLFYRAVFAPIIYKF